MHEHDQDIIMALAEGSLDPEAAAHAAAAISACDECRADLELQRLAITTLRDAPAVYLSASESARLHDQLRRQLRISPVESARAPLGPAWSRWAALAAGTAAVLLVAFLVLPSVLGGDDDADTVALEQTAEELAGGAEDSRTASTAAAAEAPSAAVPSDDAADMDMALEEAAPPSTVTPAETTAAPQAMDTGGDGAALAYQEQGSLSEDLRSEVIDQLIADPSFFEMADAAAQYTQPVWAACLAILFDLDGGDLTFRAQIIGSITDDLGVERFLVALVDYEDIADVALASITVPGCEIYETVP